MSETVRPLKINDDIGLESVSDELPIIEPDIPSAFKPPSVKFIPANARPKGPKIPQANMKPSVKFPIPQAIIGRPEIAGIPVLKKGGIRKKPTPPAELNIPEMYKQLSARNGTSPASGLRQRRPDKTLKLKVISMMELCMYQTQDGNLVQVEEMSVKYQTTKQYRMAFIMLKLEEIKLEMHYLYSYLMKNVKKQYKHRGTGIKMRRQLIYYTHLLKKNIDVTYAIEYLLEHFSENDDHNTASKKLVRP